MNVSSANMSASEISLMLEGSNDLTRDLVVRTLKLFAVRDKDKKLIGVVNFSIDWQSGRTVLKDQKIM